MSDKFEYEILEELGEFGEEKKGWKKSLNVVSWNGAEGKYDIRNWTLDNSRMGKGISLSKEEIIGLKNLLNDIDFDNL